jgi:hypothetical protein
MGNKLLGGAVAVAHGRDRGGDVPRSTENNSRTVPAVSLLAWYPP